MTLRLLPPAPPVIVSGLGRCGTSLAMQMLEAGGMRCCGDWPAFEVSPPIPIPAGHAGKVLDPHYPPNMRMIPAGAAVLLLYRDPLEQARSQVKFGVALFGMQPQPRAMIQRWAARLRTEQPAARRVVAARSVDLLQLTFEHLVTHPAGAAETIALFLSRWYQLDSDAMAGAVRSRIVGARCAPDLAIELALVAELDHRRTRLPAR